MNAPELLEAAVAVPSASTYALALMRSRDVVWALGQVLALAIPAAALVTGLGARLRTICARMARGRKTWTVIAFAAAYVLASGLLTLPLDLWRTYGALHWPGWSRPTPSEWIAGEASRIAVQVVLAAVIAWIPYRSIERSPRRWWLRVSVGLMPLFFLVLVVAPVWIAPLTTTYAPLDDAQLAAQVSALAVRAGAGSVPVVVGGDDTSVVGLGPTRRIVLQTDLTHEETPEQIDFTIGHELKHYLHHDDWIALAVVCALLPLLFFLVDRSARSLLRRGAGRFGFTQLADPASLPLLLLLLTASWLCLCPVFNLFARHVELEADRFGLELTHQNRAAASMFAHEAESGGAPEWDPFFLVFQATHPSIGTRIRFANAYRPWEQR